MTASDDPRVIRSIAVTAEDVVSAFEARRQRGTDAVLRITPPFNGRMRARLHVASEGEYEDAELAPVHVSPGALLADGVVSAYPTPDDTEDELRADPEETYTPERHHEYHRSALERWRDRARVGIVDAVTLDTPYGPHEVEVKVLG